TCSRARSPPERRHPPHPPQASRRDYDRPSGTAIERGRLDRLPRASPACPESRPLRASRDRYVWPSEGCEELPAGSGVSAAAGAGVTTIVNGALAAPSFSGPPGILTRNTLVPGS